MIEAHTQNARTARLLEHGEALYFRRFLDRAPESVRAALGVRTADIGGGVITTMTADLTGFWTKAIGIGFDAPVDDALLKQATDFFAVGGKCEGTLVIAPGQLPQHWDLLCTAHGLQAGTVHAKLACPVDAVDATGSTDLHVRALEPSDADAWNRIVRDAFGLTDPDLEPFLRAAIEDPAAKVYGAWDQDLLVAAAAVHLLGEVAALNTAATLPEYRRRGAQTALIRARAAAAKSAGAELLTVETGNPEGNPSFRNLVRAGFTHYYTRPDWRWEASRPTDESTTS